jgi:hypothetical protein
LGDKFVDLNCYFRQKAEIEGGRKFEVKGLISARSGSETEPDLLSRGTVQRNT